MNIYENSNSASFYMMAWIAFIISSVAMILGIIYLEANIHTKGYFAMGYFFTISSCFTLAKVVRDKHESEKLISKIEKVQTEKFIKENSEF
jgi:hypothetical protein